MARQSMVTRTIPTTIANVLCLNIADETTSKKEVTLSRTYKSEQALLKAVKKLYETDDVKIVHVVDHSTKNVRYGQTEQKFIENAEILPPLERAKKEN